MGIRVTHIKDFTGEPWQVYCGRRNLRLGFRNSPLANPYYLQREEEKNGSRFFWSLKFQRP